MAGAINRGQARRKGTSEEWMMRPQTKMVIGKHDLTSSPNILG